MPKFMITFYDGDMQFPEEDLPEVADAAHAVMYEAQASGVWVFGGGFFGYDATYVATDGTITENAPLGNKTPVGGFCIVNVETREEALKWAAKTAAACRCAQEVREFIDDPEA